MKKIFIITLIIAILTASICMATVAAFQEEPKVTVYRGEEWHFDVEEEGYPHMTIIPEERKEPQVYGNGYVGKAEPEEKKYDIILLGQ